MRPPSQKCLPIRHWSAARCCVLLTSGSNFIDAADEIPSASNRPDVNRDSSVALKELLATIERLRRVGPFRSSGEPDGEPEEPEQYGEAYAELLRHAAELRRHEKGLSVAQAFAKAAEEHPALRDAAISGIALARDDC
jgi:hypothetical protein